MRVLPLVLAVLLVPLVAAHETDRVVYRLAIDEAGPHAGAASFHLHEDRRLLGVGVGGCAFGSVGVLRIATPSGSTLDVTLSGTSCAGGANGLGGPESSLPEGEYAGGYAFVLTGPLLVEVYAEA